MIIFLRNIPGDTLRSNIVFFIKPIIKGGFLNSKGEIKNIEILALKDTYIKLMEYHALVEIEPDVVALRAIKKLHGQQFRGKRIAVRQYCTRNGQNINRIAPKTLDSVLIERRRQLEIIEELWPRFL